MEADQQNARDWTVATEKVDRFVRMLVQACGMELRYDLHAGGAEEGIRLRVEFSGADTGLLVARRAEVLRAMESLATEVIGLLPEEHHLISFDAEDYKSRRAEQLRESAEAAMTSVRSTGRPYSFPPMNSRERRMLHLELAGQGFRTASSGDPERRFVVVYPAEVVPESKKTDRVRTIRSAFRPRG